MPSPVKKLIENHISGNAYRKFNKANYYLSLADTATDQAKKSDFARKALQEILIAIYQLQRFDPDNYKALLHQQISTHHHLPEKDIQDLKAILPTNLASLSAGEAEKAVADKLDLLSPEQLASLFQNMSKFMQYLQNLSILPRGPYIIQSKDAEVEHQANEYNDREDYPTVAEGRLDENFSAHIMESNPKGGSLITSTAPSNKFAKPESTAETGEETKLQEFFAKFFQNLLKNIIGEKNKDTFTWLQNTPEFAQVFKPILETLIRT